MLIDCGGKSPDRGGTAICPVCKREMTAIGAGVGVCPDCVRDRWAEGRRCISLVHSRTRRVFRLPVKPPTSGKVRCDLCFHRCRMGEEDRGYCGIRTGAEADFRESGRSRALVSHYYDPLPTNCVADWVCSGGTGCGYPTFSHENGPEAGFYNLAVFFEACNLNCLYCQNWNFKRRQRKKNNWLSTGDLAGAVSDSTSCICFFGGDPVPQIPYALRAAKEARERAGGRILRICWETNGSMHPAWLKRMARTSLESGGCIKMDLKAWNPYIHRALCGWDNKHILENFERLARWVPLRLNPPLLIASTLLVPDYVGEEEVHGLASFIARINPDIPYALLAFAPQFCMEDSPTTPRAQAEACLEAAKRAGLRNVRLGNRHLIC